MNKKQISLTVTKIVRCPYNYGNYATFNDAVKELDYLLSIFDVKLSNDDRRDILEQLRAKF